MQQELISPDALSAIRKRLPTVLTFGYFNAGTLGPWPDSTHATMRAMLDEELLTRQPADLWDRLDTVRSDARTQLARLAGVSADNVSLQAATHPGINTALWGLNLQPGDVLVTTDEEHPGVTIPLRIVAERLGSKVVTLSFPSSPDQITAFADQIGAMAASQSIRAVVISHVSWLTGAVAHIPSVRAAIPAGIRIIVDGAQSAGAMDIIQAVAASDAYTISGQKWTLGPNGSGGLILQDPTQWEPTYGGFFAVEDPAQPTTSAYRDTGERFEVGMESMTPLAGLTSSLKFLLDDVGVSAAQRHSAALNAILRDELTQAFAPSSIQGSCHLLSVSMANGGAIKACEQLFEQGFQTRPVGDCVLRVSLGFWNTPEETRALGRAITEIADQ